MTAAVVLPLPLSLLVGVYFFECLPSIGTYEFSIINNSADTIGYCVYFHYIDDYNNVLNYEMRGYPVYPSDTIKRVGLHDGNDDTWGCLFKAEKIDTVYIFVLDTIPDAGIGKRCYQPTNHHILGLYKFYESNTDLSKKHIEIIFP